MSNMVILNGPGHSGNVNRAADYAMHTALLKNSSEVHGDYYGTARLLTHLHQSMYANANRQKQTNTHMLHKHNWIFYA